MDIQKWPDRLTNRDWQKKKGAFAKLTGKTGIGEALVEAERLYKRGTPSAMDYGHLRATMTVRDVAEAKQRAIDYHRSNTEPVRAALRLAADLAVRKAADWKKDKTVPAAAATAATAVATEASAFAAALKIDSPEIKQLLGKYDTQIKILKGTEEAMLEMVVDHLDGLYAAAIKLQGNPTKAAWTAPAPSVEQSCRGVSATVQRDPRLSAAFRKEWDAFDPKAFLKDCPDDAEGEADFILSRLKELMAAHKKFMKNYARVLAA